MLCTVVFFDIITWYLFKVVKGIYRSKGDQTLVMFVFLINNKTNDMAKKGFEQGVICNLEASCYFLQLSFRRIHWTHYPKLSIYSPYLYPSLLAICYDSLVSQLKLPGCSLPFPSFSGSDRVLLLLHLVIPSSASLLLVFRGAKCVGRFAAIRR